MNQKIDKRSFQMIEQFYQTMRRRGIQRGQVIEALDLIDFGLPSEPTIKINQPEYDESL